MPRSMRLNLKTVKRHERGTMNKTEQRFAESLIGNVLVMGEEILALHSWKFEAINLTLAPNTQYRPDFYLVTTDGQALFIEVKARTKSGRVLWEDASRIKFKTSAELYPEFRFICASWSSSGGWKFEEVGS